LPRGGSSELRQDRLEDTDEKERLKEVGFRLMGEQVDMVLSIGGENTSEEIEDGTKLADVAECGRAAGVQRIKACAEPLMQDFPRPHRTALGNANVGIMELFLPAGVGSSVGEIEVA